MPEAELPEIIQDVLYEIFDQDAIYGDQSHLTEHQWLAILMEQVGSLARATNNGELDKRDRAVQVAGVAIQIVRGIDATM